MRFARDTNAWWSLEKEPEETDESHEHELAHAVVRSWNTLLAANSNRLLRWQHNAALYAGGNTRIVNDEFAGLEDYSPGPYVPTSRAVYNICKALPQTFASQVQRETPRVMYQTMAGDDTLRTKAQNLTRYTDAVMSRNKIRKQDESFAVTANVLGTALVEVICEDENIKIVYVPPWEVQFDETDAADDDPTCLIRCRRRSVQWLRDNFPASKVDFEELEHKSKKSNGCTVVPVYEAWYVNDPGQSNGVHVICTVDNVLLEDREYDLGMPYVSYRVDRQVRGWWGEGLVYDCAGCQSRLEQLLRDKAQALHWTAWPHLMVPGDQNRNGFKINQQQYDDRIGSVIYYTGMRPQWEVANAAYHPSVDREIDFLKSIKFEERGLSQLTATGQKPAGLNSGEAQRVYQDATSTRLIQYIKAWNQFHVDIAERVFEVSKKFLKKNTKVSLKGAFGGTMQLPWKELDLDRDAFNLTMWDTSMLPIHPAARLEKLNEMLQAQQVDPETYRELSGMPDVEGVLSRTTAPRRAAEHVIVQINAGKSIDPLEDWMDLKAIVELAKQCLCERIATDTVDKGVQVALERVIDEANDILSAQAAQAQAQQPQATQAQQGQPAVTQ